MNQRERELYGLLLIIIILLYHNLIQSIQIHNLKNVDDAVREFLEVQTNINEANLYLLKLDKS